MKRFVMKKLYTWKNSPYRKPLILNGIRQVGKTWLLREFGKTEYENVAYFNFDENKEYKQFFQTTKDVDRIVQNLIMASGQRIQPETTLVIFDEIQECNEALNTLKYFCENAPQFHVACAGSLLGVALSKPASFPVGKVDFIDMHPMTFSEFLVANGDENLYLFLESIETIETIPDAFYNPLYEKLKMFFVTGGMPESVSAWTKRRDIEAVQQVLSAIIGAYERDFAKYPDASEFPKISLLWNSIPSQLARENKKFLYSTLKSGARAREYEYALQWLCDSGLVHKVYRCLKPGLPLSAYDDLGAFKLYLPDVGLLRRLSLLAPTAFNEGNRLFEECKGALTENYILQALRNQYEVPLRYWKDDSRNEVDFILQRENDVLPIEVKTKNSVTSVSLKRYAYKYPKETPLRLRFSLNNLHKDNDMLNIPLFMADQADRFIGLALESV